MPRRWFDGLVAALFDGVEAGLVDGRYEHPDFVLSVDVWERAGRAGGELVEREADGPVSFELQSPVAPRTFTASAADAISSWRVVADLRAWRCDGSVAWRVFNGEVRVAVAEPGAASWDVVATADLAFGPWARVMLFVARPWARRVFAKTVEEVVATWEKDVAPLFLRDPAEVAAEFLAPDRHPPPPGFFER